MKNVPIFSSFFSKEENIEMIIKLNVLICLLFAFEKEFR